MYRGITLYIIIIINNDNIILINCARGIHMLINSVPIQESSNDVCTFLVSEVAYGYALYIVWA